MREGREEGSFETGIERAVEGLLVSPEFLFRVEREPADPRGRRVATYRISDLELASRLSFFLWSSIPDDELLDARDLRKTSDTRPCSSSRCAACWPTRAPTRW